MQPFHLSEKFDEKAIKNLEISQNLILGKRAELFFAAALTHSPNYNVLAQNLQIIHEKNTLGEFDFFTKYETLKQKIHIELVYKFYVYDPFFEEEIDRWIGPNRKDTLVKKLKRLKTHQLPLLFQPEAQTTLLKNEIHAEEYKQQVCFKANLFLPKNLKKNKLSYINPDCVVGFWLHQVEFSNEKYGKFQFYSPLKKDWSINPKFHNHWKSFTQIQQEISYLFQHQKSALIWMKKNTQTYERFFVVWW